MNIKDTSYMRELNEKAMPESNKAPKEQPDKPLTGGISRRDFLKLSAILTGSTVLLVNGCGYLEQFNQQIDFSLTSIPTDFKRFVLTRVEFGLERPRITEIALGSQHQNLQVSLLAYDRAEVLFFESVQQVLDDYNKDEQIELRWLD